ncbi:hypothetical protein CEXT_213501 [Caerostris extrusa]|uniref:Uncharacterized protein n=1 Tax=Caerostris extrusa TaxID=172846 RepID=A0AAV4M475_CAEEX|nr:hypothetical protein CEXT_213501 [Caerostris extrusa]
MAEQRVWRREVIKKTGLNKGSNLIRYFREDTRKQNPVVSFLFFSCFCSLFFCSFPQKLITEEVRFMLLDFFGLETQKCRLFHECGLVEEEKTPL